MTPQEIIAHRRHQFACVGGPNNITLACEQDVGSLVEVSRVSDALLGLCLA